MSVCLSFIFHLSIIIHFNSSCICQNDWSNETLLKLRGFFFNFAMNINAELSWVVFLVVMNGVYSVCLCHSPLLHGSLFAAVIRHDRELALNHDKQSMGWIKRYLKLLCKTPFVSALKFFFFSFFQCLFFLSLKFRIVYIIIFLISTNFLFWNNSCSIYQCLWFYIFIYIF